MKSNLIIEYLKLSKIFLSLAVAFSAFVGYSLSQNIDFSSSVILILGVFLMSSAASAINQIQERKTDLLMRRTENRPIPSKKISVNSAIVFSVILITIGFGLLLNLNIYCALLGLLNVVIYNLIYTPLKYKSQFGLIAGGLVGAIPPVIGWSASGLVLLPSIVFFSVFMFLWQIPHFWILLAKYKQDYVNANIKSILESVEPNNFKLLLFIWILSTSLLTFMFPYFEIVSGIFGILLLVLINVFVIMSFIKMLFFQKEQQQFKFANISVQVYLLVVFFLIIIENSF
ncbi:MAG: protoheme IX farnesyltransferase [Bacteroidia bacterium]|nr:protoheme IX farnesyltransferase [Bacteroidia bacterium]